MRLLFVFLLVVSASSCGALLGKASCDQDGASHSTGVAVIHDL